MKKTTFISLKTLLCFLGVIFIGNFPGRALAQQPPSLPDTSKMTYNQISAKLGLYAFPAKEQTQQQQKADEFDS